MSKQLLDKAHDLILRQDYDAARDILRPLAGRSTTARRWLQNLDEMQAAPGEITDEIDEQMGAERDALDKIAGDDVMTEEQNADNGQSTGARHDVMGVPVTITDLDSDQGSPAADGEPNNVPDNGVHDAVLPPDELAAQNATMDEDVGEMPVTITDVDEMPIDDLAGMLPPDKPENSPAEVQWEYREVVLHDWARHMDNVEAALEDNGDSDHVTVEDTYTQQLNVAGAAGWEVVSEQVLPEQRVRLLMKRRKRPL